MGPGGKWCLDLGIFLGQLDNRYSETPGNENALRKLLRERFGLTKKETEIAIRLIQNERQAEIVESLDITLNTFKTHRRRIYEKLGAARQIDLVADGNRLWSMASSEYEQCFNAE